MSLGLEDEFLVDNVHAPAGDFEGVEKKLVLDFKGKGSLRDIRRSVMDTIFMNACCSAISLTSNDDMDAYVLSESSCFVYPKRIVLKTCGTTEPIGAVPAILGEADKLGLTIHSALYCHMDFLFPKAQSPIYRKFTTEQDLLSVYFPKAVATNLSVGDSAAWNIYTHGEPTHEALEILMYDLDRDVMDEYFKKVSPSAFDESAPGSRKCSNSLEVPRPGSRKCSADYNDTEKLESQSGARQLDSRTGITSLADPEAQWDSFLFSPCGYSANGILGETYWTVHVTPEKECSYVSFEISPCPVDIGAKVDEILNFYKPGRFSIVVSTNTERQGPDALDGFVSCGVVREQVVPGYNVWVGHFATPEHIKQTREVAPPTTVDKKAGMVDQQSSKFDSGAKSQFKKSIISSLTGKFDDYGLFPSSPDEKGVARPKGHFDVVDKSAVLLQRDDDNSWDAYSSTEEREDNPRYEKRSKTSLDESDHKEARVSQVGVRLKRATKVVG